MHRVKSVDEYIQKQPKWSDALVLLRRIMLELGLEEAVKWGGPVYMLDNVNLFSIGGFKSFVSIWFYQGALLKDEKKLLVNAQEGITKAQRQMRFTSEEQIHPDIIKAYVLEAIANHRAGRGIKADKQKPLVIPPELEKALNNDKPLAQAFDKLTLAKRREYAEYIINAKRSETKLNRLKKIIPMILRAESLSDKYRQ